MSLLSRCTFAASERDGLLHIVIEAPLDGMTQPSVCFNGARAVAATMAWCAESLASFARTLDDTDLCDRLLALSRFLSKMRATPEN